MERKMLRNGPWFIILLYVGSSIVPYGAPWDLVRP